MAWAMTMPYNFGQFRPDGELVGWEQQLAEYRNTTMPADEKAYFARPDSESHILYVFWKFVNETGTQFGDYPVCRPLNHLEVPKRLEINRVYKSLGSFLIYDAGITIVDDQLKSMIERLEPNAHSYWPMTLTRPRRGSKTKPGLDVGKTTRPRDFYMIVIGNHVDSFSPALSNPESFEDKGGGYWLHDHHMKGLMLRRADIAGRHVWRENRLSNRTIFFSNQLVEEAKRAGLRLPKAYRFKEL